MAATMSRNISNITEITKLMDESKATGIMTKGPDVNESYLKFSVNRKGDIRFGLGAIKGVGESAVQSILEERERNGEYKDIFDFVQRVNLSACNRKNIENLALAGAFDSFTGIKREDFFVKNAKDETFTEVWYVMEISIRWIKPQLQILCLEVRIKWILLLPKSFRLLHGGIWNV